MQGAIVHIVVLAFIFIPLYVHECACVHHAVCDYFNNVCAPPD